MVYVFSDGEFTFWTAHYGSWNKDRRIVFRVRNDSNPFKRAEEKQIKYFDRLLPSSKFEVENWINNHTHYVMEGKRSEYK